MKRFILKTFLVQELECWFSYEGIIYVVFSHTPFQNKVVVVFKLIGCKLLIKCWVFLCVVGDYGHLGLKEREIINYRKHPQVPHFDTASVRLQVPRWQHKCQIYNHVCKNILFFKYTKVLIRLKNSSLFNFVYNTYHACQTFILVIVVEYTQGT